jgi:hypothetical protein
VERTLADLIEIGTDLSVVAGAARDAVRADKLVAPDRLVSYLHPIAARRTRRLPRQQCRPIPVQRRRLPARRRKAGRNRPRTSRRAEEGKEASDPERSRVSPARPASPAPGARVPPAGTAPPRNRARRAPPGEFPPGDQIVLADPEQVACRCLDAAQPAEGAQLVMLEDDGPQGLVGRRLRPRSAAGSFPRGCLPLASARGQGGDGDRCSVGSASRSRHGPFRDHDNASMLYTLVK